MPNTDRRPPSMHLAALVLVGITGTFVTALILMTGELLVLWPLYLIPIVIAALVYHVAGAVLAAAVASAILSLALYATGLDPAALPELAIGMGAFTVSGIVIGLQARRSHRHGDLLETASIFDPLTGLYKREYFDRRLTEEVRRAERYGLHCSVVLVQIECFEAFKEQFGHYKAAMLIEHLGEVVRVSVRDSDIIARYGPTSLVIALPVTDIGEAGTVAERLGSTVAETEFEGDVLEPATHCAVQTACATFPEDACDRDGLLRAAEVRLGEPER
ncbi:MAG: GGDEF domain-containing protein [Coriobacteriia bacterium]|nr:GGDEF domain-containing protein [Coriobacteriia bacterium]